MYWGSNNHCNLWEHCATKPEVEKAMMVTSELQIGICIVLLVDQNFSYHISVITGKQVI